MKAEREKILPGTLCRFDGGVSVFMTTGGLKKLSSETVLMFLSSTPRPAPGYHLHSFLDPDGEKVFFISDHIDLQDELGIEILT